MLTFITGLNPRSKRAYITQTISDLLDKNERVYLLVPEQSSFDRDRELLFAFGEKKSSKLTVTSFTRFTREILADNALSVKSEADDTVRAVLMSLACEQVSDSLTIYKRYTSRPNSIKELLSSYSEIKQAGLSLQMLNTAAAAMDISVLRSKSQELYLIFSAYEALITERFSNSSDNIPKAAEFLSNNKLFNNAVFIFDDFRGYTAQQHKLMSVIIAQCSACFVSVTAENLTLDTQSVFIHAIKNADAIKNSAKLSGVRLFEINTDNNSNETEAEFLCKYLYSENAEVYNIPTENITVMSAADKYAECEGVAAAIQKLLQNGLRCRDICVFERGSFYAIPLTQALKKRGIPVLEDLRHPFCDYSLIKMLLNAVNIAANGFTAESLLQYIKTGIAGITDAECDELENYITVWSIDSEGWLKPFTGNPDGYAERVTDSSVQKLVLINNVRERAVSPLIKLRDELKKCNSENSLRAVYGFLTDINAAQNYLTYALYLNDHSAESEANECARIWEECMQHLDALSDALQGQSVSPKRFYELLSIMLVSGSVGDIPAGTDQIIIGSAERTRFSPNTKAIFILGLNDGVFPKPSPTGGIFTANEKRRLAKNGFTLENVPESFFAEERLIAYNALTSFSHSLFVSYSTGSITGEEMRPSELIGNVLRLFPDCRVIRYGSASPEQRLTCPHAAFEEYAAMHDKNTVFAASVYKALSDLPEYAARLAALNSVIDGSPAAFADSVLSQELFGKDMYISPSRLESYSKCAFMYFCRYGAEAGKIHPAALDARVNGLMTHNVFEVLFTKYSNDEISRFDAERIYAEVDLITEKYVAESMGGRANMPESLKREIDKQKKEIAAVIDRMSHEFGVCSFKTVGAEIKIGNDGTVKPYTIKLPNGGSVTLHGIVDRMDVMNDNGTEYFRVIDYKTGGKELKLSDCLSGLNMQMLIYLMCLWDNGEPVYGKLTPAGALYVPAKTGGESCDRRASDEEVFRQKLKNGRMKGVYLENESVIKGMESAAAGVYIDAKIDDKCKLKGNFLTLNQFYKLRTLLNGIICEKVMALQNGKIPASPVIDGSYQRTCEYCDYADVCLREDGGAKNELCSMKHADIRKMLDEMTEGDN